MSVQIPVAQPVALENSNNNHHNNSLKLELDAKILLTIENVEIYHLENHARASLGTHKVIVYETKMNGKDVILLWTEETDADTHVTKPLMIALRSDLPILELAPLNFVFPTAFNYYYGLIIPSSVDYDTLEVFMLLLAQYGSLRQAGLKVHIADLKERESRIVAISREISTFLETNSEKLAGHIQSGVLLAGTTVYSGSESLKTKITPGEEDAQVSESLKQKLKLARTVSKTAVKVSATLASAAVATSDMISKHVSAYVSRTDNKAIEGPETSRTSAAKSLARSSILAFTTITHALTTSGLALLNDVKRSSSNIAQHKYGPEGAGLVDSVGDIVIDVAQTSVSLSQVGMKAVAKSTALKTTVNVLDTTKGDEVAQRPQSSVLMQGIDAMNQLHEAKSEIKNYFMPSNHSNQQPDRSSSRKSTVQIEVIQDDEHVPALISDAEAIAEHAEVVTTTLPSNTIETKVKVHSVVHTGSTVHATPVQAFYPTPKIPIAQPISK